MAVERDPNEARIFAGLTQRRERITHELAEYRERRSTMGERGEKEKTREQLLKRRRDLETFKEAARAQMLKFQSEIDRLDITIQTFDSVMPVAPRWEKIDVKGNCRVCEKPTFWRLGKIPKCHLVCKPERERAVRGPSQMRRIEDAAFKAAGLEDL